MYSMAKGAIPVVLETYIHGLPLDSNTDTHICHVKANSSRYLLEKISSYSVLYSITVHHNYIDVHSNLT